MSVVVSLPEAAQGALYTEARAWLESWPRGSDIAIAYHGDADGTGSAALAVRYLERTGRRVAGVIAPGKGQEPYDPEFVSRLRALRPEALIVLDQGSKPQPVLPGIPTLVVDHHELPTGRVPADIYLNGCAEDPIPSASLMTFRLLSALTDLSDVSWYASLGIIGDLGRDASFPEHTAAKKRWGQKNISETVALINAAKRASAHDTEASLAAVLRAETPSEIADGMIAEYDVLDDYRTEVQQERARCAKAAPRFAGDWALLQFASACQIHGPVAASWIGRLPKHIVIAANEDYTPGHVHFSIRTRRPDENLLARLRVYRNVLDFQGTGQGYHEATGGVLAIAQFGQLIEEMGFAAS